MFEKINWSETKTLEKKEKFEQIIWEAIKRIESGVAGTPYTRHGFSDIIQSIWAIQNTTIAFPAM